MRRAAKRDRNEGAIVSALEAIGAIVRRINDSGLPDLAVFFRGRWFLLEVKVPGEHLTPAQMELYRVAPFPVVQTVEGALAVIGVWDASQDAPRSRQVAPGTTTVR